MMRIRRRKQKQAVHPLVPSHANAVNTIALLLQLLWFCCYSITPTDARKGKLELSNECETVWRRSPVRIDDVYLVCDSPGAYYGGKSAYQNSVTCRQGDRAKVALDFSVLGKWDYTMGMNLTIQASFYGIKHVIQDHTDICYFGSLEYIGADESDSYKHACPLNTGSYELYTTFTVPSFQPDKVLDFTPDLYVEFVDARNARHVLGCASTGTVALLHNSKRRAHRGRVAFMWSFVSFMILFSTCFIVHRRKSRRYNTPITNDYRNNADNNQASASVMQRFQYRQTTRNGTVVIPHNFENAGAVDPHFPANPVYSDSSQSSVVGKLRQRLDDNGEDGVNLTSLGLAGFGGDPGGPSINNESVAATQLPTTADPEATLPDVT